jgi:hypothetical protein
MKQKLFIVLLLQMVMCHFTLRAQQAVVTSGGNAVGTGGSSSYSIGQTSYNSITGSNGTINEGVQQPYEIFIVSNNEVKGLSLFSTVYPNPAVAQVTLRTERTLNEVLTFRLYDVNSKLLLEQEINSDETVIPTATLATGIYILKVSGINNEIQSFRIIKNQ